LYAYGPTGGAEFFASEVWTWVRWVISFLLFFIPISRHMSHGAGMPTWLKTRLRLSILSWSSDWHASVASWIRSMMEQGLSRLQCGARVRRPVLSEVVTHVHQERILQGRGTAVRLPVVTPH
jgi:hypothetical protein